MALTLSIVQGAFNNYVAGQPVSLVASVTNSGSTSVTLSSLAIYADPGSCSFLGQPVYLTPNMPVGLGNPVLTAGSTYSYPFEVIFQAPNLAGPSPQAPGLAAGSGVAANPSASVARLTLQSLSSDSTTASVSLSVPVLSTLYPFPVAQGGAMQLSSGFNLVNLLTSFA